MGHFSPERKICAACSGWVGGREVLHRSDTRMEIKTFQTVGYCHAKRTNASNSSSCSDFSPWSALQPPTPWVPSVA
jgi:hypothetical protein